jgi:hypothetical protein
MLRRLWQSRAAPLLCFAVVVVSVRGASQIGEGFHHDIDETIISVSSKHACALTSVPGVSFGGKPVCWGNAKFGRLNQLDVCQLSCEYPLSVQQWLTCDA